MSSENTQVKSAEKAKIGSATKTAAKKTTSAAKKTSTGAKPSTGRKKLSKKALARRRRQRRMRMLLNAAIAVIAIIAITVIAIRYGKEDTPSAEPTATPVPTVEATATPEPTAEPTVEATATVQPTEAPIVDLPVLSSYTEGGIELNDELAAKMPYRVHVSKDTFTCAVLGLDANGEYTRLLHTFRTAIGTGNKTRAGTYMIDEKFDWYAWSDGGYTPFTCHFAGTKMRIHSPLHNDDRDWNSLYKKGYEQIGTQSTQGCLRTTTEWAAWIYFNCDLGTIFTVGNDSTYTSEAPPALNGADSDPTRPLSQDDIEVLVSYFDVAEETVTMTVGEQRSIELQSIKPDLGAIEPVLTKEWKFNYISGNDAVVTVDENGMLTAVGAGTAKILVIADDLNKAYRYIDVTVA